MLQLIKPVSLCSKKKWINAILVEILRSVNPDIIHMYDIQDGYETLRQDLERHGFLSARSEDMAVFAKTMPTITERGIECGPVIMLRQDPMSDLESEPKMGEFTKPQEQEKPSKVATSTDESVLPKIGLQDDSISTYRSLVYASGGRTVVDHTFSDAVLESKPVFYER